MAIVRAVKSGNWSDTTVWNTGALPTSEDDVYSNTFTVTIDMSPTVLSISSNSATGVTAGGLFVPTNGITITCTGAGVTVDIASNVCMTSSLTAGQSCTIVANVSNTNASNGWAVANNGAGTINIVGNVTTGRGTNFTSLHSVINNSTGIINITGNVTGGNISGASTGSYGVLILGSEPLISQAM